MLGGFVVTNSDTVVAKDSAEVTVAIGVVSSDALGVGSIAMPDPFDEPDYPWLYWASIPLFWPVAGSPRAGSSEAEARAVAFDIRSMRKIKPREGLAMVAQYTDNTGTPPVTITAAKTRVLVGT